MTESTGPSNPSQPDPSAAPPPSGSGGPSQPPPSQPPPSQPAASTPQPGTFGAPPDLSKAPEPHADPAAQAYGAPPQPTGAQPGAGQPGGAAPQYGSAPQGSAPQYGSTPPPQPPAQPYGAMPPPTQGYGYGQYLPSAVPGYYVDNEAGMDFPNGTALASHGRRIGAFFLAIPLSIVTLGIGYIIWGAIVWGRGTSPALQVLGCRAYVPETRQRGDWGTMAKRDIPYALLTAIPFVGLICQIVSFIWFLTDNQRRTMADRIGGTVIVHDPNKILDAQAAAAKG